jgi:hypothetical protein
VPQSQADFTFTCYTGDYGKRKTTAPYKWQRFWDLYTHWHGGFSGDLWAEDMELCLGSKKAEYSQGNLREWIKETGEKSASFLSFINPEYVMPALMFNELEDTNYEQMVRASYRLAALLNEAIK